MSAITPRRFTLKVAAVCGPRVPWFVLSCSPSITSEDVARQESSAAQIVISVCSDRFISGAKETSSVSVHEGENLSQKLVNIFSNPNWVSGMFHI